MPKLTNQECWDILEDRLQTISETRLGKHLGASKLAVSVIVSAGRDNDVEFIESGLFDYYCKLAALHIEPTKALVVKTLLYIKNGGSAKFRQSGD